MSKLGPQLRLKSIGVGAFVVCIQLSLSGLMAAEVTIPDASLRVAIRAALDISVDQEISEEALASIISLDAHTREIRSLKGLESATNLAVLELGNNSVADISNLENLASLKELHLSGNSMSSLTVPHPHREGVHRLMLVYLRMKGALALVYSPRDRGRAHLP